MTTETVRAVLAGVCGVLLGGCASFNDSVVIDIGDQFELLRLEHRGDPGDPVVRNVHGFDCTFSARSQRLSLFGGNREIEGRVRCRRLDAPEAVPGDAGKDTRPR